MIKLEIVNGSLQISNEGSIILVAPKNSCAIDVLALYDTIPFIVIYNKYLGNSTVIFTQPLSNCEDSTDTPFTVNSFIAFAKANLGFDDFGETSPFQYDANATGIEPILGINNASGCFSIIGGGQNNTASATNSTIGGGLCNISSGANSTIGGGRQNTASNVCATIGGGYCNTASGNFSTIGGGAKNNTSNTFSTVGGGCYNRATGNSSTIGGGCFNNASGDNSTIAGGCCVITNSRFSFIGGGQRNIIQSPTNQLCSFGVTIGGGIGHNTTGGTFSTTTGDLNGSLTCSNAGKLSTIGGGFRNIATGLYSTISGGYINIASGDSSSILGGRCNTTNTCACAMIVGSNITADRVCTTFVNNLSIKNIPTSSAGLPSGSVWNNLGVLAIVT